MSKPLQFAVETIQHNLVESESEIDLAIARSATLLASMMTTRVETSSPFSTGQVAIMRLVKTIGSLSDARTGMARVHADLLRVGQERGDYVGGGECPNRAQKIEETGLKLVA
jgi:hypothetical protein